MAGDRVLTVRIAGDAKGAVGAIGQVQGAGVGLGKKMLKVGGMLAGLNFGANLIGDIKSVGMSYDRTMNSLQAVSRATESEMEKVGEVARDLGADLTLPATSAADATGAILSLTKGGLDLQASMDAAKGSIQLAAAAQIDGARAAQIQAATIKQFSLSGEDATHVADVLANTANSASGSIEDVAGALKYVGPIAQSVSMSIDDTATAIGVLAQNGITGQKAGTALRGIISSLANPSDKAAAALKDLSVQAFDAQGNFVGLRKISGQLAKAKQRLTEEEYNAAAAAAFGREPLAAINAYAKDGKSAFDGMADAVAREGGAADVAAAKNKGFGGALDGLGSQLEDFYLIVWDKVKPALEEIATQAGNALQKINGFIRDSEDFGKNLSESINNLDGAEIGAKLSKVIGDAIDKISDMSGRLYEKFRGFVAGVDWVGLGIEAGKAALPLVIGLTAGIINALTDENTWMQMASHWQDILMAVLAVAFMPAKWAAKLAGLLRKIPFVGKFLAWIVSGLNKVGSKIKKFIGKFFKRFWRGFKKEFDGGAPGFIKGLLKFGTLFQRKLAKLGVGLAKKAGKVALDMAERFGSWLGKHGPAQGRAALVKVKDRIFGFLRNAGSWLLGHGKRLLGGLIDGIGGRIGSLISKMLSVKSTVTGWFRSAGSWLWNAGSSVISGFINGITSKFGAVKSTLGGLTSKLTSWKGPPQKDRVLLPPAGQTIMDGFTRGLESRFGGVKRMLGGFTSDIESAATSRARNTARTARGSALRASEGSGGYLHRGNAASASQRPIQVNLTVEGHLLSERDFVERITPDLRDAFIRIGKRNGGRIFE